MLGNNKFGITKHRVSGKATKSPKLRHMMKRVAEQNECKSKPSTAIYNSIQELMKSKK